MDSSFKGMRILVTGSTSGVGEQLVRQLARRGAKVLIHGRDASRVQVLANEIRRIAPDDPETFTADLACLSDVATLATAIIGAGPLGLLVNNAGVGFGADRHHRELSRDGFELRFAVNYLAPFLLTELLTRANLPEHGVINVASAGQAPIDEGDLMSEHSYDGVLAYRRSKLALIIDTFERAQRDSRRAYLTLHPGTFLATKMVLDAGIEPQGTAEEGAEAVLGVIERALRGDTGQYFERGRSVRADDSAYDPALQRRLRRVALSVTATANTKTGQRRS